ncbi:MAG: RNA-binding S4 domain-containing protein [candidate division Zixibacteria bacterium]|nr:RNA-binding S4 domain-containing protein [candidate division Zixibacteria bacterium]
MRVDDYLSTVGVIKRRTVAKEMGTNGLVEVNGRRVKPAYEVHLNDIICIKGSRPVTVEVLDIPSGSVPKERRDRYVRYLDVSP